MVWDADIIFEFPALLEFTGNSGINSEDKEGKLFLQNKDQAFI
ncbi:15319_t:CDS:2 [Entrophospora sp. SA101]|nr:6038_t:CDS:2 [Entrophospora sp. SA101]CAJ0767686.1 15319_t:CDS:2 [Entrophospora sp. SA101]CAJ0897756.1 4951_t:CDS:2 [Entrophospora sp. SA101]